MKLSVSCLSQAVNMTPALLLVLACQCASAQVVSSPAAVDTNAYQAELLADAQNRAFSLADGEPTSGYIKKKFTLSDGGPNTLQVGGYLQQRYLMNFRDVESEDDEDFTNGFQIARARVVAGGTTFDKRLSYNIAVELGSGTSAVLNDAEVRYTFDSKFYIRAGQYKLQFLREEIVSDNRQLVIDRSITNSVFSLTRSQGAGIGWTDGQWRLAGDISDGGKNLNTDFDSSKEADFAFTGRVENMVFGDDIKRFDDLTSWKGATNALLLGAAFDFETYGDTGPGTEGGVVERDIFGFTADASFEGNGWNALAAFVYNSTEPAGSESTDNYGVLAQAGFFITASTELYARYDVVIPDDASGPDSFNTITAGVNYYIAPESQTFKLSGDVVYNLDPESETAIISAPQTANGFLTDNQGDQVAVRVQLQLVF